MQKKFASKGVDIIQTTSIFIDYSINPTIGYTPQSDDTDKLMKLVKECVGTNTTGYQNETEMTDVIANNTGPIIGIVFKVDSTSNTFRNGLEYTLRAMPNKDDKYQKVQICLDISYIEMITNVSVTHESLGIKTTQMKTEVYKESLLPFDVALSSFCIITLLVFVITYSVEMVYIAKEKAVGINALMSLNGIKNWMNLLSWLVTGVIWNFLLLIPIVLMLKFSWVPESNAFMEKGNPILIFMAFSLHIVHLLCFGYHIASYFNKLVTSISFLCSIRIIKSAMEAIKYQETAKYLEIISPSSFLTGIFNAIERYERQGMTIGFMNMFSTELVTQPFETSIGMIMLFSILGAILHFFMALYIHAIKPGEYGVKRHPLAWFLKKKNITEDEQIQLDSDYFEQKKEFEKIPAGCLKAGVQIRKLKKIYSTGFIEKDEFHALKEVSIDFYRGEITALLGHNGAGKTTMMSILSGLTGSSGGVVIINGKNVLNNHDVISNNVGLCPQANITVPDLNVYQQVLFFAKLRAKNKTSAQIKEDVENLLLKVNLQDKKNCALDQLSGGQKRRLCLTLAVIGDANVLIFDEPTSGIDTEGKRDIWDMILAMKSNKTILISTHDMEEADILGDRIAIMHSGKINSYGTSMFLKKLHGDGQVKVTLSLKSSCDTAKILEIIGEDVKTLNQRNDSIVLAIPNSESLPETLDKLEFSKKKLGITGISASIITLEQIFVKVTEEVDHNVNGTTNEIGHDPILFNENKGFDYLMQTLWGYVIKKQAYAMRSPWSFLLRLILPCLIVVLIFLCSLSEKPIETVDLTLNEDSVSLYKKWKASEEMIITNRNYTNFAFGNERFITAEYNNVSNKTLNVKQLFYSDNQKDEISKTINFIDNTLLKIYSNNSDSKIQASKKDIYLSSDSIYQKDGNINMRLFMIIPVMNNSITNITETDELVQKERDIVSGEVEKRLTKTIKHKNENVFLAHELRKSYGNLQVVKDISFRVKSGECFGLLGVNGAGKSTTFKMLTGEESACHGKMYLKDIGMHDNRGDYLSKMGYCPQHDALIETLNAWDHLYLFARLRGVPESQIKSSVEGWIKRLNLTACASRPSRTYSGGNKRRLNIALALIGQPSLVLMDEPTTGVDPAARRSLWNTLKYCQKSGQSIILTSHSMEECEALCNRLVIMVNGKLVCVGAVQELKQRFGAGYNIHVKMSPASSVEDVQHIKETIESTIRCQKMDENSGFLGYHVTDPGATWTVMYRMMNTLKNNYNCIEDFAVLSSTLEQLFIQFARAEHTDLTSHEIP
ncbi:hypothetical protein HCN44_000302 [Aphidius gifuensis]|uniref:ABC transporter domain-containing protein n=1 Tax=Aphidius gifuensis TaxID=684658 RepID=A0A835CNQ2_APHGI|nr:hypothetical protein HCN44_000302 [Aphidius gifuensis]